MTFRKKPDVDESVSDAQICRKSHPPRKISMLTVKSALVIWSLDGCVYLSLHMLGCGCIQYTIHISA
jgi:hypothetical protein